LPNRKAVSAVMDRPLLTIPLILLGGTMMSRASWLMLMPIGFMNSSKRISPGWMGSSFLVFVLIGSPQW
jgi:hypothetical protein